MQDYMQTYSCCTDINHFIKKIELGLYKDIEKGKKSLKSIIVIEQTNLSLIEEFLIKKNLFKKIDEIHQYFYRLIQTLLTNEVFYYSRNGYKYFIFKKNENQKELQNFLDILLNIFNNSFNIETSNIKIYPKIGISIFYSNLAKTQEELTRAEIALQFAKQQNDMPICFFSDKIYHALTEQMHIKSLIEYAVKNEKIILRYQPIYRENNIEKIEVLSRIVDQHKNIVSPMVYVNILEESEYLVTYEEILVKKIVQDLKRFPINYNKTFAINISMKSFLSNNIYNLIQLIPEKYRQFICFEITERVFYHNDKKVLATINHLQKLNFKIALDDFGSEYSSLKYITEFNVNAVKLDMSFTSKVLQCHKTATIVKYIISLCKDLAIEVIAEGIEKKEQLDFLKKLNCDLFQGYYLEKPLPMDVLLKKIACEENQNYISAV